jgi:EAL domain-containing protein (putative c-di-GMP-specific phosphodiesterase class I)
MASDEIDCAMVEAINKIGHQMGLKTIAEFVDSAAIMDKLKEIGVDYAQGNWIHIATTIDDLCPGE